MTTNLDEQDAAYKLTYFFDYQCYPLWSVNDAALQKWGHAVDCNLLPLTDVLKKEIEDACALFDTSLNWDSPGDPSPWSKEQKDRFNIQALNLFEKIKKELGETFLLENKYIRL